MEPITIRNLPTEILEALERESLRLHEPLENTVIELLRQALSVRPVGAKRNGLARLAGTWTEEEYRSFEASIAMTEQIDEELWR
jgi:plasmid stability protein